jgi:metallophosphoesterase superfamily enzyme
MTVVEDTEPDCPPTPKRLFVILSDVHLVSSDQLFAPKYLFITGDLTDTGSIAEWDRAWSVLKETSKGMRIIIAPGNHDQNAAFVASRKLSTDEVERLEAVSI